MRNDILCMNSDAMNRYHFMIPAGVLEKSLKEVYRKGMPYLIGHNVHMPIGWIRPFGLYMEPGLTRMMVARQIAENTAEQHTINKGLSNYMTMRYKDAYLPVAEAFMPLIKDHLSGGHKIIDTGCVAIVNDGLAVRLYPGLFDACDDDGLVPIQLLLDSFVYCSQGIFKSKDSQLCLFAHEYFRRSQSRHNNFHFFFLDALMKLTTNKDVTIRLRLDKSMIGYAPSVHEVGELAFHYGPGYTDDISEIKPGITRLYNEDGPRCFTGVSATEFYWKVEDAENTFELEELQDDPSPVADERYHCRYSHAIFKKQAGYFHHFDGAIRSYDLEKMVERIDKKFTDYGRKAQYTKLFRLDGKIEIATWKSLLTDYMQDNPLLYEYYGLAENVKQFDTQPVKLSKLQEACPFIITKEEGLKVLLSYHSTDEKMQEGRYIDIYDLRFDGDINKSKFCAEWGILELQKAIQRIGGELDVPKDLEINKIDDLYWNIPSIMHAGENASTLLNQTIEAMLLLFKAMRVKGVKKIVSLSLAFIFEGRVVRVSSFGWLENQVAWLEKSFPFPATEQGLTQWVTAQREYLMTFTINTNAHLMESLVQHDGVLLINRMPVLYAWEAKQENAGISQEISFHKNDEEYSLVLAKKLASCLHFSVEKAVWSDTKEDYRFSKRSKWLDDDGAKVELMECRLLGLYWTPVFTT